MGAIAKRGDVESTSGMEDGLKTGKTLSFHPGDVLNSHTFQRFTSFELSLWKYLAGKWPARQSAGYVDEKKL